MESGCSPCQADLDSGEGAEECSSCPDSGFVNADQTGCETCQPGTHTLLEDSTVVGCVKCAPGWFSEQEGVAECTACGLDNHVGGGVQPQ